jgi:hypothetical protein
MFKKIFTICSLSLLFFITPALALLGYDYYTNQNFNSISSPYDLDAVWDDCTGRGTCTTADEWEFETGTALVSGSLYLNGSADVRFFANATNTESMLQCFDFKTADGSAFNFRNYDYAYALGGLNMVDTGSDFKLNIVYNYALSSTYTWKTGLDYNTWYTICFYSESSDGSFGTKWQLDGGTWSSFYGADTRATAGTSGDHFTFHAQGSAFYLDNFWGAEDAATGPNSEISWYYPNNDYEVSNDEWSNWAFYVDLSDDDASSYPYQILRVTYYDSLANYYIDIDEISTTSELTYWTIARTNDLVDGPVSAYAEIWGSTSCTDYSDSTCEWYSIADSPWISFTASTTGYTLYDNPYLSQPGFTPSTSSLEALFGSSTDDISLFSTLISPTFAAMKSIFPFTIGANVYEQWELSSSVELPSAFSFITDNIDSEGNLYWNLNDDLFLEEYQVPIMGPDAFMTNDEEIAFFGGLRGISTYFLYIMFIAGMGWRGAALHSEYTN